MEGWVFQYSGGSIRRETFFQENKKNLLVNIFSVTESSRIKELFKKIPPKSPEKTFFNFDFVIRLVPS